MKEHGSETEILCKPRVIWRAHQAWQARKEDFRKAALAMTQRRQRWIVFRWEAQLKTTTNQKSGPTRNLQNQNADIRLGCVPALSILFRNECSVNHEASTQRNFASKRDKKGKPWSKQKITNKTTKPRKHDQETRGNKTTQGTQKKSQKQSSNATKQKQKRTKNKTRSETTKTGESTKQKKLQQTCQREPTAMQPNQPEREKQQTKEEEAKQKQPTRQTKTQDRTKQKTTIKNIETKPNKQGREDKNDIPNHTRKQGKQNLQTTNETLKQPRTKQKNKENLAQSGRKVVL